MPLAALPESFGNLNNLEEAYVGASVTALPKQFEPIYLRCLANEEARDQYLSSEDMKSYIS